MKKNYFLSVTRTLIAASAVAALAAMACSPPPGALGHVGANLASGAPDRTAGGGGGQQDDNIVLHFAPGEANAPAPSAFKVGMRLTYNVESASIAGMGSDWSPNEQGVWVNKTTGEHFDRVKKEMSGSSHTYEQYDVIGMDDQHVMLVQDNLMVNPNFAGPTYDGRTFLIGAPGFATRLWANTDALNRLPNMVEADRKIVRQKWRVGEGGKMTDAVVLSETLSNSKDLYAYDLASGLMLEYSISGTGPATALAPDETQSTGNTIMVSGWFLGGRMPTVPWADDPDPEWTKNLHTLTYTVDSVMSAGADMRGAAHQSLEMKITMGERRGGCTLCTRSIAPIGQPDAKPNVSNIMTSPKMLDPLWIAPEALARLKAGDTIDSDNITGITVKVGATQQGPRGPMIAITYENRAMQVSGWYDLKTGLSMGGQSYNSGKFTRQTFTLKSSD